MEHITEKELFSACRRQEKKNLKTTGSSLSAGSMSNRLYDYIAEVRIDEKNGVVMKDGWRDFIKTL